MINNLLAMQETKVKSMGWEDPWRRKWQPTPVFLPGESYGQRRLVGYRPLGHKESYTTKATYHTRIPWKNKNPEKEMGFLKIASFLLLANGIRPKMAMLIWKPEECCYTENRRVQDGGGRRARRRGEHEGSLTCGLHHGTVGRVQILEPAHWTWSLSISCASLNT